MADGKESALARCHAVSCLGANDDDCKLVKPRSHHMNSGSERVQINGNVHVARTAVRKLGSEQSRWNTGVQNYAT